MFTTDNAIFLFAILLIIGVLATKFSTRLGLPALVFFIIVGMVLGNFIYYDNASLTQLFGILALIVILFEGGMQTKWKQVKPVVGSALSLATLGVILTSSIVGISATYILGVSWQEGMLFGAIVGSTDAAAVFAVIGNMNLRKRITTTLEAESGTNDPMAVFLTIALIQIIQTPDFSLWVLIGSFLWQMAFGLIMGLLMGKLCVWSINKINLDSSGLYPVLAMAFAIASYSTTALLHGSGLLAVYVMAIILGNSELTYRHSIFRFNEGFAWMMQILMFILLGLLVFPSQLLEITWQGIVLSIILMFIARPIGTYLSMLFSPYSLKEKTFISWAGLRGAVPIVLATYPMMAGLENSQLIFNIVFFVVLSSALLQGATILPLANKLGLSGGTKINTPHSLELVSIGKTNSEMIEVEVENGSLIANKEVRLLGFPEDTLITAVIRGEKLITPKGSTILQYGDILYIMISKAKREEILKFVSNPTIED